MIGDYELASQSPCRSVMPEDDRIHIDAAFLADVGLSQLTASEANVLLQHIYETLELRAGVALAQRMSLAQLDEFEVFFDAQDDEGAFKWLSENVPDFRQVVRDEFDLLALELRQIAPAMLSLIGPGR